MRKKYYFYLLFAVLIVFVFTMCAPKAGVRSGTRVSKSGGCRKKIDKITAQFKFIPVRKDSFQNKITPDFNGTTRKAPRKINEDWSDETIYFIMTDRFCDGDTSNDYYINRKDLRAWQGGDFAGLIKKLDYIKDLGFSAIWITPPVDQDEVPTSRYYHFYHGYHAKDFYSVDEHLGDIALYKKLVKEAHKRGIKVLQDIVFNHCAYNHPFYRKYEAKDGCDVSKRNEAFKSWFHDGKGHPGERDYEYKNPFGEPDFDQTNPHVVAFQLDYAKYWIEQVDIDGFRLDTVKHVTFSFWPKFVKEIHKFAGPGFYLIGEIFEWSQEKQLPYLRDAKLDAAVDFPLWARINQVFRKDGNMNEISKYLSQDKNYPNPFYLGTFIDNHDVERFATGFKTMEEKEKRTKLALTFIYGIRGVPIVYYGTEVLVDTGADYKGRPMMPWKDIEAGKYNSMINYIKKLNKIRRSTPALTKGNHMEIYKDYAVYAFIRAYKDQDALVIINNHPTTEEYTFEIPKNSVIKPGSKVKDAISGKSYKLSGNKLKIKMSAKTGYIFIAKGKRSGNLPAYVAAPFSKRMPKGLVLWKFSIEAKGAKKVTLAGDFNAWDMNSIQLSDADGDGVWEIEMPLKPGKYQYKFIVDGSWTADPNNPNTSGPPYNNSVLEIK